MSDCFPLVLKCLRSGKISRDHVLEQRQVFVPNFSPVDETVQDYEQYKQTILLQPNTQSANLGAVANLHAGLIVIQSLYPVTILGITTGDNTDYWTLPNTSFFTLCTNPSSVQGAITSLILSYQNPVLVAGIPQANEIELFMVRTVAT